jgi:polysaccharide export outer membrane protein
MGMMHSNLSVRLSMVLLGLGLLTAGSGAQSLVSTNTSTNTKTTVENNSSSASAAPSLSKPAVSSRYTLGAADVIHVNVWKSPDLSQTVTIGPDGFVSLPLLGEVRAAGLTAEQLAADLTTRLASYVVHAQVTVSVVDIRSRQVFITGQVGKPGAYPLIAPITVLQLIAQAGGLNTFANRKDIFILRNSTGNMQRLKFNYNSAIHGDVRQNISLQPGDTVIIP